VIDHVLIIPDLLPGRAARREKRIVVSRCPIYRLTIDRVPSYGAPMTAEAQLDIHISSAPDGCASPTSGGHGQQAKGQPPERGGSSLLAFGGLLLLLLGGLALLIWLLQPFADQVGGCGGG